MTENNCQRNILLSEWLKAASESHLNAVCKMSDTSLAMMRQYASGRRNMSASKAERISEVMSRAYAFNGDEPKALSQGELCEACHNCTYFKNHKG